MTQHYSCIINFSNFNTKVVRESRVCVFLEKLNYLIRTVEWRAILVKLVTVKNLFTLYRKY